MMGQLRVMMTVLGLLFISSSVLGTKRPNIVFIVADDLGWNDVGWHNRDILTPNLDQLARQGVTLNNSYVQPVCTPSRTAFMTGRYPFRAGLQHNVIHPPMPSGVPTNFTFLPEKLKEIGYATHIIGKWHLGFCNLSYTPLHRGFDSHYGYYLGEEDYYQHDRRYLKNGHGYDFWNNSKPDRTAKGTYSTFLFAKRAKEIIKSHNIDTPLYLYLPFQAVHYPVEVPFRYEFMYRMIRHKRRRQFSGMVTALDEAVGNITNALDVKGMLDNTIIVFTTDNGGRPYFGGNNWPLRGQKLTLWEGGTRGPAFVTGGVFNAAQGHVYEGLFHAVDWFPTLLSAVNYTGNLPLLDGINQMDNLLMRNGAQKRTELIYNIDDIIQNAAIRIGNWKLIVGSPGPDERNGWTPCPTFDTQSAPDAEDNEINAPEYLTEYAPIPPKPDLRQLFDLGTDPTEHHDLSKTYPYIVNIMYERLLELTLGAPKAYFPPASPASNPKYFGGVWSPGWCKAR